MIEHQQDRSIIRVNGWSQLCKDVKFTTPIIELADIHYAPRMSITLFQNCIFSQMPNFIIRGQINRLNLNTILSLLPEHKSVWYNIRDGPGFIISKTPMLLYRLKPQHYNDQFSKFYNLNIQVIDSRLLYDNLYQFDIRIDMITTTVQAEVNYDEIYMKYLEGHRNLTGYMVCTNWQRNNQIDELNCDVINIKNIQPSAFNNLICNKLECDNMAGGQVMKVNTLVGKVIDITDSSGYINSLHCHNLVYNPDCKLIIKQLYIESDTDINCSIIWNRGRLVKFPTVYITRTLTQPVWADTLIQQWINIIKDSYNIDNINIILTVDGQSHIYTDKLNIMLMGSFQLDLIKDDVKLIAFNSVIDKLNKWKTALIISIILNIIGCIYIWKK
jgi:hypothetical protein